ncbi:MAG TPA: serine/threonine-protein kinase [Candidatus Eisenbacteria bacterium]|nr:serine/threonine-protein kinase [Candidatus Eisenbacteria bacterium]
MHEHPLNRIDPARTPSSAMSTRMRTRGLPADVLEQSCKRIAILAVGFAALWLIPVIMDTVVHDLVHHMPIQKMDPRAIWPMPGHAVAFLGVLLSAALFLIARMHWVRPQTLLRLGLVYEVMTACLVAFLVNWKPVFGSYGVSWLCVIILTYPAIVPTTPRSTFIAAFLSASMDPLWLYLAVLRGEPVPRDAFLLLWAIVPTYACVALAVVPSHIIMGLGRQVNRARDLGAYQVGELIGKGGMGEVYRAHHRFLARPAAIKLIRPEALARTESAELTIQRFRREAQAAAALRSPHTISLYDFGVTDEGVFYYVMELLEGVDFESLVRRFGPVSADRTVALLRQACRALGEAHSRGMVHRDVKPSNLHACRLGPQVDFVKVLDFGLVKLARTHAHGETLLTSPDVTTGTPAYMAPEMALGEIEIDHRADIYALGCVAYWLLTGRLVFEAENAVKMMLQHVQSPPTPPSRVTEMEVPEELDRVVLACLAKDPAARPASAADLARWLDAVPVRERWTAERAEAWWEKHLPAAAPATTLRSETPLATVRVARDSTAMAEETK